jgi:2-keto-4-pentenoate hydratase
MTPEAAASELLDARASRRQVATFSGRDAAFDLTSAYAVEAAARRVRAAEGHHPVGRKVGFANKAVWRILNLETLVWAHIYDDTVHYANDDRGTLSLSGMVSPKIEPEIVFKLKDDLRGNVEPTEALRAVDWIALGFEIIDCPFPEWSFKPTDFVAAFGLHAALMIGTPRQVDQASISTLIDELARFKVQLLHEDAIVAEGSGKNVLRSPALCLAELASAISKRTDVQPLSAGELVSSGTLTDSQLMAGGETWTARVSGLDLPALTIAT